MAASKLGRKALSALLAAAMVASLNVPISAWAGNGNEAGESASAEQSQPEGPLVASPQALGDVSALSNGVAALITASGTQQFGSVQEAINAAPDGAAATVQLQGDSVESITIPAGKNITLDLHNQTLTGNFDSSVVINNGTLAIADSYIPDPGAPEASKGPKGTICDDGILETATLVNNGVLTVSGGIISGVHSRSIVKNNATATLAISGGSLVGGQQYAVENWGNATISGGKVDSLASGAVLFTSIRGPD